MSHYLITYQFKLFSDAPKCSYKGPQRIYGAIGEKILLVCDMTPYPGDHYLEFEWKFQEMGNPKMPQTEVLGSNKAMDQQLMDKFHYSVDDEKANSYLYAYRQQPSQLCKANSQCAGFPAT